VRQRIRFADLARIVGRLPAALLAAYSGLAPPGARAELEGGQSHSRPDKPCRSRPAARD
jgi:hypothetical protein